MGPWPEREKERSPEALHHSTQLCTLYKFKRPGTLDSQQESGREDPRHHPLLIRQGDKEASREQGAGGKPPNSQGPSPRRASGLHSALPEDHSCFIQISRAHLHLHPSPEGHHRELAIIVRTEGAGLGWGGTGQRPSCPQGTVAGSQGKAFALAANGAWVPGSLDGGGILFLEPPPLMPYPLLLH